MLWFAVFALFTAVFGGDSLRGGQNTTESYSTAIKPWYRNQEEKDRAVRLGAGKQEESHETPVYWSDVNL
jgi:hypothetical protein